MFYDRYAMMCKQRGISMSAAAIEAGISKSLVTKWKTHETKIPSPDILQKLSTYFGVSISELVGEEEQKNPTTFAGDGDEVTKEILDEINSMSMEEKQTFLDFVRMFKARKEG